MHLFRHQAPPNAQGGQFICEIAFRFQYISSGYFQILSVRSYGLLTASVYHRGLVYKCLLLFILGVLGSPSQLCGGLHKFENL